MSVPLVPCATCAHDKPGSCEHTQALASPDRFWSADSAPDARGGTWCHSDRPSNDTNCLPNPSDQRAGEVKP